MGASAQPTHASPDGRYLFGTLAESVASKAKPTVIVVKTKQSLGLATFDARALTDLDLHGYAFVGLLSFSGQRGKCLPPTLTAFGFLFYLHSGGLCSVIGKT